MTRVLLLSPEPARLVALQQVLRGSGLEVQVLADHRQLGAGFLQSQASVVLIAAPPSDVTGAGVLGALVPPGSPSGLPPTVLLVTRVDPALLGWAFACGVVDLVEASGVPPTLGARVQQVLQEISQVPPDHAQGLGRLVRYLRRAERTGELWVDGEMGRARVVLSRGQMREAVLGNLRGKEAIAQLLGQRSFKGFAFTDLPPDQVGVVHVDSTPHLSPVVAGTVVETPPAPTVVAPAPEPEPPPMARPAIHAVDVTGEPAPPGEPLPPVKAVVVDDDKALLEIACKFLARSGLEVTKAHDGGQALDEALRVRPDVIVSDIMMPSVDGWALLRLVREDHRLREVPFILLSCHDEYRMKLSELDAGADGYLAKGIRGDQLAASVAARVEIRRQVWSLAAPGRRLEGQLKAVGPLNLVNALAFHGCTGALQVHDGWVHVKLGLSDGRLVSAEAGEEVLNLSPLEALRSYVTMDQATFVFDPREAVEPMWNRPADEALEEACLRANENDDRVREELMVSGEGLIIHTELMSLYERVCGHLNPRVVEALARGLSPAETMVQTNESPLVVEWVVKDMVRKGVVSFRTPQAP
ncbi:MAG: response regulator [Myxococcota bacterium]